MMLQAPPIRERQQRVGMETLLAPEIILCENDASFILKSTRKRFVFEIESNAAVYFVKKKIEDVSREFDEFQVNTHLCKLRCWYL